MTDEEKKYHQNVLRVATNLGVLLDIGLFPGKHALGVEECKGFVKSVADDATGKLSTIELAVAPLTPSEAQKETQKTGI